MSSDNAKHAFHWRHREIMFPLARASLLSNGKDKGQRTGVSTDSQWTVSLLLDKYDNMEAQRPTASL